ncbi:MAG: hypothetical protein ACP6IP_09470 [Candidatus Njordarchaeia archaeon]
MSITVSIKVKKEIFEIAEKMVALGLARSRSQAFNIMIERGISEVREMIEYWEDAKKEAKRLKMENFKLKHGGLLKLLEEDRDR